MNATIGNRKAGKSGLSALALMWAALIIVLYIPVWRAGLSPGSSLSRGLLAGTWLFYAHFFLFAVVLFSLAHAEVRDRIRARALVFFFVSSLAVLFSLAKDRHAASIVLLSGAALLTTGYGTASWLRRLSGKDVPLYAGVLLSLVVLEAVLFAAGLANAAGYPFKAALAAIFLILAGLGIVFGRPREAPVFSFFENLDITGRLFAEGVFLAVCLAFVHAVTPETLVDASALHLLKAGKIAGSSGLEVIGRFPQNPFTLMSSYVHVIFAFFWNFAGEHAVKGLTWVTSLIMTGALYDLARVLGSRRRYALGAAGLFLFVPGYIWHYGCGYIDAASAAFAVGGLALLARGFAKQRAGIFYGGLSGLLFGAAAAAKLVMIVYVGVFAGAFALVVLCRKPRNPGVLISAAVFCGLVFVPHALFQYQMTGNPVFPALNTFFQSPYWNNDINPGAVQMFARIGILDWLTFPYTLAMKTSLFGSAVENVNGSAGPWFLVFFPLVFWAFRRPDSRAVSWAVAGGCLGYILVLAVLGTCYFRYYIPLLGPGFCLMAAGASSFRESPGMRSTAGAAACLVAILLPPQLMLRTVWAPGLEHWSYYRQGGRTAWLEKHFPGYAGLAELAQQTPDNTRIFAYGFTGASHLPRPAHYFRTADILFGGSAGYDPGPELRGMLRRNLWEALEKIRTGETARFFDQTELDRLISEHGDMLVISRLSDLDLLGNSRYTGLDRLYYASSYLVGTYPWFVLAYGVDERMFPPDKGEERAFGLLSDSGLPDPPRGWMFETPGGGREAPASKEDVWAAWSRYLRIPVDVPEHAVGLKLVLDFAFLGETDYAPGVQINWLTNEGETFKYSVVPVFYSPGGRVGAIHVCDVPEQAQGMAVAVRPNTGKAATLKTARLFWVFDKS